MAFIKLVSPSGWDFDRPSHVPIKLSSRGLVGHDRREFLKSASHEFANLVDTLAEELRRHDGDYEPVHGVALGATEAYGPNRNGDGFKEAVCRRSHPTFVKHARHYRNHKNKPPGNKAYGHVKASAYNDAMRRVELVTYLYKSAAAAERHGGYVADLELEKLARGEDIPTSMSARVPHDECSWCKNKARVREEYCTAEKCAAGGLADHMSHVVKVGGDLHHLHADNPEADWFDNSTVARGADRIAWGASADYLTKAASANGFVGLDGHKVVEAMGISAPLAVLMEATDPEAPRVKLAYALAALEAGPRAGDGVLLAFHEGVRGPAPEPPAPEKLAACLAALADEGCVLPLREFARLSGRGAEAAAASSLLPRVFTKSSSEALAAGHRGWPEQPDAASRAWAARCKEGYSLDAEQVERRSVLASLRGLSPLRPLVKSAGDSAGRPLAEAYASYQLAALERAARRDADFALTAVFSAYQNQSQ